MSPTPHISWNLTDRVHDDAGGAGITWQCPDCKQELTYAPGGWWELECSCEGRTWDLDVSITYEDRASDKPPTPGSLVERVALTRMNRPLDQDDLSQARAAIREVAAAVIEWHDSDQLIRTAWEAGKWLEREANQ
jgi:hypothetical protein